MKEAQRIIDTIVSSPESCDDGALLNDLLRQFHRGYPVENLRPLLSSENEKVVKAGIWIASELGRKAAPLLHDVAGLLHHPVAYVRYYAIDSILTCTTRHDQTQIGAVVSMLDDPDARVRWQVLNFMWRASTEQLEAALGHFEEQQPDCVHVAGLRWLIGDGGRNPDEATSWIRSDDLLWRKYGVVAAARMAGVTRAPLTSARSVDDEDVVSRFAADVLRLTES